MGMSTKLLYSYPSPYPFSSTIRNEKLLWTWEVFLDETQPRDCLCYSLYVASHLTGLDCLLLDTS
jgi:hypothetical protein